MKKSYKQCQSCAMPLKQDKKGGGSEKDGTLSKMYCSFCYKDGEFIQPNMSLEEMQKFVDDILKNEMKASKILRWLTSKQLPRLARWKNS